MQLLSSSANRRQIAVGALFPVIVAAIGLIVLYLAPRQDGRTQPFDFSQFPDGGSAAVRLAVIWILVAVIGCGFLALARPSSKLRTLVVTSETAFFGWAPYFLSGFPDESDESGDLTPSLGVALFLIYGSLAAVCLVVAAVLCIVEIRRRRAILEVAWISAGPAVMAIAFSTFQPSLFGESVDNAGIRLVVNGIAAILGVFLGVLLVAPAIALRTRLRSRGLWGGVATCLALVALSNVLLIAFGVWTGALAITASIATLAVFGVPAVFVPFAKAEPSPNSF